MIELLIEVVGEFLLQALVETLLELGLHSLAEPFRRPPNPWLTALGYTLFGAIFGALSLLVFPENLVPPPWQVPNLLLTPIVVGGLMVLLGRWRAQRGQTVLGVDRFAYGYVFALSLALVRFVFAG